MYAVMYECTWIISVITTRRLTHYLYKILYVEVCIAGLTIEGPWSASRQNLDDK